MAFIRLEAGHLHVSFGTQKTLDVRILERPGRWMNQAHMDTVVAELRALAAKANRDRDLSYGVFASDPEVLQSVVLTLIRERSSGQLIAFNALRVMDIPLNAQTEEVVHLGLVMVDPDFRAKGLSWILYGLTTSLLFAKNGFRPLWMSNVTQVPAIVGLVAEGLSRVFPNPKTNSPKSFEHLVIAREIMQHHRAAFGVGDDARFDEENFIIEDSYTGGSDNLLKSWEEVQKHRVSVYNDFCQERLNYKRGDDVLQLAQMDITSTAHYFAKSVPSHVVTTVLLKVVMVFLTSLFVPVLQWFSTSKQMGDLRPWAKRR